MDLKWLIKIALMIASAYALIVFVLYMLQHKLLYFPTRVHDFSPTDAGLDYEPVWLKTKDNVRISGWFIPAEQADLTLLFFHGNAGNISHRLQSFTIFNQLRLNVFIIDYRGYGRSEGRTSERGTYLDADAAWLYLTGERKIPPDKIVIFGRSLGGAVASWLAARHKPRALILESAFTSIPDMGAEIYPWLPVKWLVRLKYDNMKRITSIGCPKLIIHSQDDEIVPYHHGQKLFNAAREPKHFLNIHGTHNVSNLASESLYVNGLAAFLKSLK